MDTGETLDMPERVIVSPAAGVYEHLSRAATVVPGDVIGHVTAQGQEPVPVRSPFAGRLVEIVAWQGERVSARQRIAWLRVA